MVFHASVEPFRSCLHLKTLLQNSTEEDPGTWMDRKLCWLWFVISEGSSALAAELPSHRNPGLDVWKCLVLAGFLSLSSPVPSMLCCEATSSFGLNCMQIGFTLWHCFAHFFRQAQRARWLQDGWKNIPKEKLSEAFTAETSLHSLLCQGSLLLHYLHFECPWLWKWSMVSGLGTTLSAGIDLAPGDFGVELSTNLRKNSQCW